IGKYTKNLNRKHTTYINPSMSDFFDTTIETSLQTGTYSNQIVFPTRPGTSTACQTSYRCCRYFSHWPTCQCTSHDLASQPTNSVHCTTNFGQLNYLALRHQCLQVLKQSNNSRPSPTGL